MYEITLLSIEQNKFGVICGECSIKKCSLKKTIWKIEYTWNVPNGWRLKVNKFTRLFWKYCLIHWLKQPHRTWKKIGSSLWHWHTLKRIQQHNNNRQLILIFLGWKWMFWWQKLQVIRYNPMKGVKDDAYTTSTWLVAAQRSDMSNIEY